MDIIILIKLCRITKKRWNNNVPSLHLFEMNPIKTELIQSIHLHNVALAELDGLHGFQY